MHAAQLEYSADQAFSVIPGETMFVPPYDLILKHLGTGPKKGAGVDDLTVPRRFLNFLLRRLLEHVEFDAWKDVLERE